jgi:putative ATP-dependent endonuclease of the OLD family
MYLSRLVVKNYRSIKDINLKFNKGKNVIVGRNNSGKSNIVKAIDLLLGETSPTWNKSDNITDNDFYKGNTEEPIFIWCELVRIKDEDNNFERLDFSEIKNSAIAKIFQGTQHNQTPYKIKITNFLEDEIENIFEFQTEEGSVKLDDNDSGFKKQWIGGKSYCKSSFDKEFQDVSHVVFAFEAKKVDGKYLKSLAFLYRNEDEVNSWNTAIGSCSNMRPVFLQSAIIPAFRDPKDQLRISNWTWYGKLLKEYVKDKDDDLVAAFNQVKIASNKIFEKLQDKVCNKNIDVTFPNTKLSFQFNPDSKQDIHKSTLIYVDDGFNSELKDKGSGIQSAVIIGLFDFYVREVARSKSSVLVIEEPELYLHPHGRRVISDRLNHFLDGNNNQVIITTHSSEFITTTNEDLNIIVVSKDEETTAKNIDFNSPKRKQVLIRKQNAEIFFADAVILTEDLKYFLEVTAKKYGLGKVINDKGDILGGNWLNNYNISIINCGGKNDLWKYTDILKELEIPSLVVADFDFLRNGISEYFTNLKENKEKIDRLNYFKSNLTENCKSLSEIKDKSKILSYIEELKKEYIFILSGELENFYKIKPKCSKEQGVLETISCLLESGQDIDDFVHTDEFLKVFDIFTRELLKVDLKTK